MIRANAPGGEAHWPEWHHLLVHAVRFLGEKHGNLQAVAADLSVDPQVQGYASSRLGMDLPTKQQLKTKAALGAHSFKMHKGDCPSLWGGRRASLSRFVLQYIYGMHRPVCGLRQPRMEEDCRGYSVSQSPNRKDYRSRRPIHEIVTCVLASLSLRLPSSLLTQCSTQPHKARRRRE